MLQKMGFHLPKSLQDGVPPMIVGASIGGYVGWLTTAQSQEAVQPVAYLSLLPIVCIVVFVVSAILWYRRGAIKDNEDAARDRKLDDIHGHFFPAPAPEAIAESGLDVARGVGSSLLLNPGDTFSMAIGAGPAILTVPSGGRFGPDAPETLEFLLDNGQHNFTLPDGGKVTIIPSGTGHSEAIGLA